MQASLGSPLSFSLVKYHLLIVKVKPTWSCSKFLHALYESLFIFLLAPIPVASSPISLFPQFPFWASKSLCVPVTLFFSIPSAFLPSATTLNPFQPHCTRWLHFMRRMYSWRPPIIQNLHNSSLLFPQDWIESMRRREMNLEVHKIWERGNVYLL